MERGLNLKVFAVAVLLWPGSACYLGCERAGCQREEASRPPVIRRPSGTQQAPGSGIALQNPGAAEKMEERPGLMSEIASSVPPDKAKMPGESEKQRDLEAELEQLVGNPVGCMKPRSDQEGPGSIRISVEASVTENGVITRTYVSSPELSAEELECIDQRVAGSRFKAPVEEAPRTVRTVVEIRRSGL
jgi:hypothetical protein